MKICPNCKSQNDDTTDVCRYCGAALPLTPPPYQQADQTPPVQETQPQGQPQYQAPPQQQYQAPPQQQYQAPPQQQYQAPQQYTPYAGGYQNTYDPRAVSLREDISTARTLGIVSIVFLFVFSLVTLITSIIGMNKANDAIQQAQMLGDQLLVQEANEAKKLNKISLIVLLVLWGLGIIGGIIAIIFAGVLASY